MLGQKMNLSRSSSHVALVTTGHVGRHRRKCSRAIRPECRAVRSYLLFLMGIFNGGKLLMRSMT